MRFLKFLSASEVLAEKDLLELENFLELAVAEDNFIAEACAPLIKGGKRLRPMLFMLCAHSKENYLPEKILPLAAALELIHTASLVHDDILDGAKKRRGVQTINSKYDAQTAVLIGDYLFAKAFQFVAEGNYGAEVSAILSRLVGNLCIGEIMQDRALFVVPTLEEYYTRINLKTAIFLSSCCQLGGIIAELNHDEIISLANYGNGLGLAFQIVDDLLDFFGEEKITGKPFGGDLKSGVITLPVIRALQVSEKSDALKKIVESGKVSDTDVATAAKIVRKTDAFDYCKTCAENQISRAKNSLPPIKSSVRIVLEEVANFVVVRSR